MAEKGPQSNSHEKANQSQEKLEVNKSNLEKHAEKLKENAEKAEKEKQKNTQEAQKTAEKLAKPALESEPKKKEAAKEPTTRGVKNQNYRLTMNRIEAKLPTYQRAFSKVIHNQTVDNVSAVTAKTVARPSAFIGAGLVSFVGMSVVLYFANRLGFEVSSMVYILLLAAGWAAGLLIDLIITVIRRRVAR